MRLPAMLLLLFGAVICLIRPWGDYPLNDDWVYSWVAKHLAETGHFSPASVGIDIGASLVGQSLIGAAFVKAVGFSHTALRVLTLLLSGAGLVCVERILKIANVSAALRATAVCLLIFNPFFLHLSTTFMTEIYGYVPGLMAVVMWFRDRERRPPPAAPVSWFTCLTTAALVGGTFWIRQFCVVLFPALVGSVVLPMLMRRDREAFRRTWPRLAVACVVFLMIIVLYFCWAMRTGNFNHGFSAPMGGFRTFSPREWYVQSFAFWTYMALFLCPLFLLFPWRSAMTKRVVGLMALAVALGCVALFLIHRTTDYGDGVRFFLHRRFPFLTNVIFDTGVGPVTLTEVYMQDSLLRPRWPGAVWWIVEGCLFLVTPLWIGIAAGARVLREVRDKVSFEIFLFGVLLGLGLMALVIQVFKGTAFDRYYIGSVIGLLIAVCVVLSEWHRRIASPRGLRRRQWLSLAAIVPMAFFSVAGVHDYFRWNDARWQLYRQAVDAGVERTDIDGGYEVNGWATQEHAEQTAISDHGRTNTGWYREPRPYRIAMGPVRGYDSVREITPGAWLARLPAVLLLKRSDVAARHFGE